MSQTIQITAKTLAEGNQETREQLLRLPWEEIQWHSNLAEFVRLDGSDRAGQPFWMILQAAGAHAIHILAYGYRAVVERALPGSAGIISIKHGEWGHFQANLRNDGTARFQCESGPVEPSWRHGPELEMAIGNIVNYVSGNFLLVKAVASEIKYRYIKQWDLPMEFALNASNAKESMMSQRAEASAQAARSGMSDESLKAPPQEEAIQKLIQGQVLLLRKGGNLTLTLLIEGPVMLRVFVPDATQKNEMEAAPWLAQTARTESRVHMRLLPTAQSSGAGSDGLQVISFDPVSKSVRMENLGEHNVVGVTRLGDGKVVDAVKLRDRSDTDAAGVRRIVQIENLGPDLNLVVAVWVADPLLPLLKQGRKVGHGRYTLDRTLGAGGMGIVWLAFDEQLKEFAALKFLGSEVRKDTNALEELRKETLKSRQLSHPHIVRIHDLHLYEDEPPFISMEYVEGSTLNDWRQRQPHGLLTWPQLAPLMEQLCQALDYAHREGVVHRDLKPSNLMVDKKGRLKLADFGIAAAVSDSTTQSTLSPVKGTLGYMSPQHLQGKRARVTDDIYAFGATLYDLLTSTPPFFTGEVAVQILTAMPMIMADRLADLELEADIPGPISALVMSCLEKDPSRRPQSARVVAKIIREHMTGAQTTTFAASEYSPGFFRRLATWWRRMINR